MMYRILQTRKIGNKTKRWICTGVTVKVSASFKLHKQYRLFLFTTDWYPTVDSLLLIQRQPIFQGYALVGNNIENASTKVYCRKIADAFLSGDQFFFSGTGFHNISTSVFFLGFLKLQSGSPPRFFFVCYSLFISSHFFFRFTSYCCDWKSLNSVISDY